jgi:hypothetical protein
LTATKNTQKLDQSSTSKDNTSKAYLRNFGNGKLQFTEQGLKFFVEKGRLKKQKEIAKEIPLTNIESVTLETNELAVLWNGVTDRFIIEDKKLAAEICEKINEFLSKPMQKPTELAASVTVEPINNEPNPVVVESPLQTEKIVESTIAELTQDSSKDLNEAPMPNVLAGCFNDALPTVDLLFDILGSFHGAVNWNRVKICAEQAGKKIVNSDCLKSATADFYFPRLLSDIHERNAEIIPKEAYHLLESIYLHFKELTSREEFSVQIEPSPQEVMAAIESYYVLNDIVLAGIVEDVNVQDEMNHLVASLENLKGKASFAVDSDRVVKILNKLGVEQGTEEGIEDSRAVFKQQLKFLKKRK